MTSPAPVVTTHRRGLSSLSLRHWWIAALLGLAVAAPFVTSGFRTFQFTLALTFVMAILGLDLLTGYTGIINLATASFFGIGAYTVIIASNRTGSTAYWAILVGALFALVLAPLIGIPVARLKGWNVALLTIGVGVAFPPIMQRYRDLTGGSSGIAMSKPGPPAWTGLNPDQWIYFLTLAVATLLYFSHRHLVARMPGRALLAIKDNELAARALGINAARLKVVVYTIAAVFAALAGAMWGLTTQFAEPQAFALLMSIQFLLGIVIGGMMFLFGPLVGGFFLEFGRLLAEELFQTGINLMFGLLLIIIIYVAPRGLPDIPRRVAIGSRALYRWGRNWRRARRSSTSGEPTAPTEKGE